RGKGTIGLFDTSTEPAQDRTGDLTWLRRQPAAPGSDVGPMPTRSSQTIEIDLAALGRAVGLDPNPSLTGLALCRIVTLADGGVMTAEGVLATVASLALNAPRDLDANAPGSLKAAVATTEVETGGPWVPLGGLVAVA